MDLTQKYQMAEQFLAWNALMKSQNLILKVEWMKDSPAFWYIKTKGGGFEFVYCDSDQKITEPAFDQGKLAASLSQIAGREFSPSQLPIFHFDYINGRSGMRFSLQGNTFECDFESYQLRPVEIEPTKIKTNEVVSPDGKWAIFLEDYNLWVRNTQDNSLEQVTFDGEEHFAYGMEIEDNDAFLNNKFKGIQVPPAVVWAPDSSQFIVAKVDLRDIRDFHFYQSTPDTPDVHPVVHNVKFRIPTDEKMPTAGIFLIKIESKEKQLILDRFPTVLGNPINYGGSWWDESGENIYFIKMERYFQHYSILRYNLSCGKTQQVYEESNDTFVNIHFNHPFTYYPRKNELIDGDRMIWWSQKDNWGHLYLIDLTTGQISRQLTKGEWYVYDVLRVNFSQNYVIFLANGRESDPDPYYRHLYRLNLETGDLLELTPEPADHEIILHPKGTTFIDIFSTVSTAPKIILRDISGEEVMALEETDLSYLQIKGWVWPETFESRSDDGKYTIYGTLFKPLDFDPSQKYPVIDYVYGGLQKIHAPKAFPIPQDINNTHIYWASYALAQLGFIVVTVDGRGTPNRSKEFHDFCYRDIAHDNGLADHVAWIKDLGKTNSWIDLDRIGIFGHSAGGGTSVRGLISHPDFYKVGVASAAVYDNRLDQTGWIETFLGPYDKELYNQQSMFSNVDKIEGKLLIVQGEMDENVPYANAMKMVKAMVEADKDVDLLVFPNKDHWYVYHPYFFRKYWNYFVQHLLEQTPPKYSIQPIHPAIKLLFGL